MPIPDYDNTLIGQYIRQIENPDSVGFDRRNRTWMNPKSDSKYKNGKFDKNNRGFGVDIKHNPDARKVASKNREKRLTEQQERDLRNSKIKEGNGLVVKYQDSIPATRNISPEMRAMAIGAIYRGDGPKLWKDNNVLGEAYATGDDETFNRAVRGYYKAKGFEERANNHDVFMEEALKRQRIRKVIEDNNVINNVTKNVEAAEKWADSWKERANIKAEGGSLSQGLQRQQGAQGFPRWENLPISEKAAYIRTAVDNGVTTLPEIRKAYNEFAMGGALNANSTDKAQETYETNRAYRTNVDITRIPRIYGDGGDTHQQKILKRANEHIDNGQVYNNYHNAVDASLLSIAKSPWTRFASGIDRTFFGKHIPAFGSNCTLNATQWIDPDMPLISAKSLTKNPQKYGYVRISEEESIPGDLVITDNRKGLDDDDSVYHTMLLTGFYPEDRQNVPLNDKTYNVKKGDAMVSYSKGRANPHNLVKDAPLAGYLDQSEGKKNVRYYRNLEDGAIEGLLPVLTVTPQGNYYKDNSRVRYYYRNKRPHW